MMHRARKVVVIGGGITGAFAAYFLASLGAEPTVLERGEIGGEASGANAGGLNPLQGAGIPGPMQELALASLRLHRETWPRLAGDIEQLGLRTVPRVLLALDDAQVRELAATLELYRATDGLTARWLERDGLRRAEPLLCADTVGGLWTDGNARVDPAPYTRAVAAAAQRLGAGLARGEACGLVHTDGHVRAVELRSGEMMACDGVVIATGPWCAEPERWLSIRLGVEPVKGELLLIKPNGARPRAELAWQGVGLYAGPDDCWWLGGTEDRAGYDRSPTESASARILDGAARVLPDLRVERIVRHVAALRPVTEDGLPIVGIPPGYENVCLALGSGRKGMLYGAGLGRAAAELLVEGATKLPVTACSPERIGVSA